STGILPRTSSLHPPHSRPAGKSLQDCFKLAGLGVFLYADDTSVTVEATTWDDVKAATRALEEDM
ncbi:Hypothetical protein FKW44_007239, partial [Caligus rogercresseyi]